MSHASPAVADGVEHAEDVSAPSDRLILLGLLFSFLFLVAPLWLTELPPMSDFPAHAAILYIQSHHEPGSLIARYYGFAWSVVPDLASELLVPLLALALPLIASVKAFLSLALLLWVFGPAAIQFALVRRLSVTALMSPFFALNRNFMMGFINYYFAAGVALIFIAIWIALEKRTLVVRLTTGTVLLTVLYLLHALAAVFFFLFVAVYAVSQHWHERRAASFKALAELVALAAMAIPSAILFVAFATRHAKKDHYDLHLLDSFPERLASISWAWFGPFVAAGLLMVVFAWWKGRVFLEPRMRAPLIVVLLVCLVLPVYLAGGWGIHVRYPALGMALLLAATQLRLPGQLARWALAALLVSTAANAALLTGYWREPARQAAAIRSGLMRVPEGAKVFVAVSDASASAEAAVQRLEHVTDLAASDRGAFVPIVFARREQHLVYFNQEYQGRAAKNSDQSDAATASQLVRLARGNDARPPDLASFPYLVRWPCFFDNLVLLRLAGEPSPQLDSLRVVREDAFYTLYAIERPSWCETHQAAR